RRRQRRHEPRKRQQADELHVNRAQDAADDLRVRASPRANVDLHASILRYLVLDTLARLLFHGSLSRASFLPPLVWLYRRPDLEAADDCVWQAHGFTTLMRSQLRTST